jgi:hypothetical protein
MTYRFLPFGIAALSGVAVGSVMLSVGIAENLSLEFYQTGLSDFDYSFAAQVFLSWFVPVFAGALIITYFVIFARRRIKKIKKF